MEVKRFPFGVVCVFKDVDEAPRLLLYKPDVISTAAPLPLVLHILLFFTITPTSGYSVSLALKCDFVYNSSCTDGVNKRNFSRSCKKIVKWIEQLHDPTVSPPIYAIGKKSLKQMQGFSGIRARDLSEYRCDVLLNDLAPNVWLQSSVGRASHRYSRRSRVRIPLKPWIFSGFFSPIA